MLNINRKFADCNIILLLFWFPPLYWAYFRWISQHRSFEIIEEKRFSDIIALLFPLWPNIKSENNLWARSGFSHISSYFTADDLLSLVQLFYIYCNRFSPINKEVFLFFVKISNSFISVSWDVKANILFLFHLKICNAKWYRDCAYCAILISKILSDVRSRPTLQLIFGPSMCYSICINC